MGLCAFIGEARRDGDRTDGNSAPHRRPVPAFAPIEIGLHRRFAPGVGLRRHRRKECLFRSACADRRPQAFTPIEIGLHRRFAPSVGLRRRKEPLLGRCRAPVGRRPSEAGFIRRVPPEGSGTFRGSPLPTGTRGSLGGACPGQRSARRRAPRDSEPGDEGAPAGPSTWPPPPAGRNTRRSPW